MRGIRELKAMFADPRMKELIDSLWREYYGLYNEKYNRQINELVEPWLKNTFGNDIEFGQAIGQDNRIEGNRSVAVGQGLTTKSFMELLLGSYALITEDQDPDAWIETDRLAALGNGLDAENRSNAVEIFKSGLFKLFNAIQLSAYKHGDQVPVDGIIQYLDKKLELSFDGSWHELALKADVAKISFLGFQHGHGFCVGTPIKPIVSGWVKTQADHPDNAGTVGIVCEVVDADCFRYITGGLLPGTYISGELIFCQLR